MKSFFRFVKKEFFHVLPVFCYFFVLFMLISELEVFLFKKAGLAPASILEIFLAAALIAKVILVIDHLAYINFLKNKPLIFPIIWKTLNYWVILFLLRFILKFLPEFKASSAFSEEHLKAFIKSIDFRLFFSVQMFYLLFLFIFMTFKELSSAIGDKNIRKIFFG
jgi:hypothetical protein